MAGKIWGTPCDGGIYSSDVHQSGNSCVWNAQYQVMKDYGYTGSAEDVVQDALAKGWYDPIRGTSPEHMSSALEAYGVKCEVYEQGNVYDLLAAVMEGKKVIVSVDSGELWTKSKAGKVIEWFEDLFLGNRGGDHALVVSGFDNTNPLNPTIVLTDTGTGQAAVGYPVKQFANAWADSHCRMVIPCSAPFHIEEPPVPPPPYFSFISIQEWIDSLPHADMSESLASPACSLSLLGSEDLSFPQPVSFREEGAEISFQGNEMLDTNDFCSTEKLFGEELRMLSDSVFVSENYEQSEINSSVF